jgi:hypothetical protein
MPDKLIVIPAPQLYTPIYCDAARVACALTINEVKESVENLGERFDRTESRLFNLMVLALVQLLAIVTGVVGVWMVNHTTAVAAAETVVKQLKP